MKLTFTIETTGIEGFDAPDALLRLVLAAVDADGTTIARNDGESLRDPEEIAARCGTWVKDEVLRHLVFKDNSDFEL